MKKIIFLLVFILNASLFFGQNNFSFVFMTDSHLQPDSTVERFFDAAARKINALNPDFIITGGDMIYTAKNGNEKKAKMLFDFMDEKYGNFKMPVYYTMGNHEVVGILPESGIDSSNPAWGKRLYEKRYNPRYYSFEKFKWKFFILDGIKILEKKMTYTIGVDSIQIKWIKEELLSTDKEIPLVISIHTPLVSPKALTNPKTQIISKNAKTVLSLFEKHNLKIVLQGHNHVYMNLFYNGTYYISGGTTFPKASDINRGFVLVNVKNNIENIEFINTGN